MKIFPVFIFIFILIELIVVSYGDLKSKRISNLWSLLNIILFVSFLFIYPNHYVLFWPHFIFPITFFIVGFFLYFFKIMGGGDSKFLSTFFLLVPYRIQDEVFYSLLYSTILIGSILFLFNSGKKINILIDILKTRNIFRLKEVYGTKFAYAPVILLSWVIFGIKGFLFHA